MKRLVLALALTGCGASSTATGSPRTSSPSVSPAITASPLGAPVSFAGATLRFDLRADTATIAAVESSLAPVLEHWAPLGAPLDVRLVENFYLFDAGRSLDGCRELGTGRVWLCYHADGSVPSARWEIPLEQQNVGDPPAWTWGVWGPLFSGQAAWAAEVSR